MPEQAANINNNNQNNLKKVFLYIAIICIMLGAAKQFIKDVHGYIAIAFLITAYLGTILTRQKIINITDSKINKIKKTIAEAELNAQQAAMNLNIANSNNAKLDENINAAIQKINDDVVEIKKKYNQILDDKSKKIGYQNIQNIKTKKDAHNKEIRNFIIEESIKKLKQNIQPKEATDKTMQNIANKIADFYNNK